MKRMTIPSEPIRLAAVGVRGWGTLLADAVKPLENAKLVACFAPTHANCVKFAERYDCAIAPSYAEILTDPNVDGVLLTTPNDGHLDEIVAAAQHGKHVFVEKPITLTVADAIMATRACADAGVILAVGHQSRRDAGVRRLKALIDSGELGTIIGVEANHSTDTGTQVTPGEWRWSREQCPGGPLIQIGIHHIDTLHYLLGPITRVFGIQRHRVIPAVIDDASVTLFEFANGVLGHLTSHYATARAFDIRVMGTRANARYDKWLGLEVRHDTRDRVVSETIPLATNDPIAEEIVEFVECIRTHTRPEVGGEEATAALAVVRAALDANASGCAVSLDYSF
jgi:predicted dehydrogenase